jgi:UDP-N-acetylmuramoyl-L-alanyl-D-glutamate--2,6-diaminopimelate ligase
LPGWFDFTTIRIVKLNQLISQCPSLSIVGSPQDCDATGIFFDDRKVLPGSIFVAIRGAQTDGHKFLQAAIEAGASAVVVEADNADKARALCEGAAHDTANFEKVTIGFAASTRLALAELAAAFQGFPSRGLFTAAVTGTNGKTTSTYMIEHVLNLGGLPTGVIGTIDHHLGSKVWPTSMTTPDPVEFQLRLKEFLQNGALAVSLEASSHALDQRRLDSVDFDFAVFTNLTRDHLDYHQAMDEYFMAKHRLFSELLASSIKPNRVALFNAMDPWSMRSYELLLNSKDSRLSNLKIFTFGDMGVAPNSDFRYQILSQGFDGVKFALTSQSGSFEIKISMPGIHNVQNAVGAFVAGISAGLTPSAIAHALTQMRGVPGRLERVPNDKGIHIFVDYAHTDDALRAILAMLGSVRSQAKASNSSRDANANLITLFGCGGDRDRGKRPLMMRVALDGSDSVVLTSDNPRTEDPEQILDDAMAAVQVNEHGKVRRYVDRRIAIEKALQSAKPGDVVLIAGKGHEVTQQIGTVKYPFSDVKVVLEILEGKSNG